MTHILAYLAGVVTALALVWSWIGYELTRAGSE